LHFHNRGKRQMIKQLLFVRGLPGSGKSYIAKNYKKIHFDSCIVCSTDDYWVRPDGVYDWNFELLGQAHSWNQNRVHGYLSAEQVTDWDTIIIVDNTNVNFQEMKPYIKMALEYGFDIGFEEPETEWRYDVEECFKRNTHGVPHATILKMYQRWEDHETVTNKLMNYVKSAGMAESE